MELKELIIQQTEEMMDSMIEIRHHLHQNPELSFQEEKTSAFIREKLDAWDIEYRYPYAQHGILGIIRGQDGGKTIALRSDMDALPIFENNEVEYASVHNGVMHACGHDVHTASLLGAIRILKELKEP